ncbi:hypothetical protein ACIQXM_12510 [Arthrobacter sp. NPDC097144]|uniref:hypothetical protein n=1 Tax=Arthrobacter sp. NPDC097144 TaxID=3363946 RepID=UPI0037F98465
MRNEPLVGALIGAIVVGYFTSTEPALLMCLILGGVFLIFAVQLLVISGQQPAEDPDRITPAAASSAGSRVLAYAAASLAVVQTLLSVWMLVFAGNLFSLFGVLCGLCFIVVTVRTMKTPAERSSRTPVPTNL